MHPGANDICLLAVLAASAATDIAYGRIYNALTYPAILAGFALAAAGAGPDPASAAIGCLVGGGVLYLMFAFRWMGGGDVKLMAAVGALEGFPFILNAMFYAIFLGGIIAALVLVWRGEMSGVISDLGVLVRRAAGFPGVPGERIRPRGGAFPFGAAIALGTLIALVLQWRARAG